MIIPVDQIAAGLLILTSLLLAHTIVQKRRKQ